MAAGFSAASKVPEVPDGGLLPSGKIYSVAVNSWSTATGNIIPLGFRFQGDDGEMQWVNNIKVNYTEDRNISGFPSKEFDCRSVFGGLERHFKLFLYCETCKWVMLVPE